MQNTLKKFFPTTYRLLDYLVGFASNGKIVWSMDKNKIFFTTGVSS